MRSSLLSAALSLIAAVTFSTLASAIVQNCPTNNVCYSVAVPDTTAKSNNGNIYFQLKAPTSYQWVALGQGDGMSGANIFVMYQDGSGNVTVSPRTGTGHVMPQFDSSTKVTLLAGSGVSGDTMTANVQCANCESWSGGSMTMSSSSAGWIAAWKSGSSLDTSSKTAQISQHDDESTFSFDLTKATVSTDSNPFVGSSSTSSSNPSSSSSSSSSSGSDSGSTSSGVTESSSNGDDTDTLISAHGVIMSVVFVVLYPIGSILMPMLGKWLVHGVWQIVTFVLMWIGFGLGVAAANKEGINFTVTHTQFGTAIVCLMILQPVMGYLHHLHYLKHQARGPISHAHIWYGRLLMLFGIINGGLGLQLADEDHGKVVAYAIVAAVVGLSYIVIKGFTSMRKRKNAGAYDRRRPRIEIKRDQPNSSWSDEIEMPNRARMYGPGANRF